MLLVLLLERVLRQYEVLVLLALALGQVCLRGQHETLVLLLGRGRGQHEVPALLLAQRIARPLYPPATGGGPGQRPGARAEPVPPLPPLVYGSGSGPRCRPPMVLSPTVTTAAVHAAVNTGGVEPGVAYAAIVGALPRNG